MPGVVVPAHRRKREGEGEIRAMWRGPDLRAFQIFLISRPTSASDGRLALANLGEGDDGRKQGLGRTRIRVGVSRVVVETAWLSLPWPGALATGAASVRKLPRSPLALDAGNSNVPRYIITIVPIILHARVA